MTEETPTNAPEEQSEQAEGTTPETVDAPADDAKPETPMIPKPRFDEINKRLKDAEKAKAELEQLKQAQADEEARKAGDIEKLIQERDTHKSEAQQWRDYATSKLESLSEGLDDAGKAILDDLGDEVPLSKRLAIAEKLASQTKTEPGFGSHGGKAKGDEGGLIPPSVTSYADFQQWYLNLANTPDGRAMLRDHAKMTQVQAEAAKKFS
jgi:hypothetical protein